ncbi:hypothetical protein OIU74_012998 [Salix koriyanagi]|uniref:Uncharacterized protein n=1 Tax=Salix koriyanagi TaxID=2511006 RepID=A0A9Q0Q830_9ROSI|nr:hypothetical protein OIU74_012998 [Salix koriyanagi]
MYACDVTLFWLLHFPVAVAQVDYKVLVELWSDTFQFRNRLNPFSQKLLSCPLEGQQVGSMLKVVFNTEQAYSLDLSVSGPSFWIHGMQASILKWQTCSTTWEHYSHGRVGVQRACSA